MKLLLFLSAYSLAVDCNSLLPRIVSEKSAELRDFTYMVSLAIYKDPRLKGNCGGSLIAERVVLTAAHCMYDANGTMISLLDYKIDVTVGSLYVARTQLILSNTRQKAQVERFVVHPNYSLYFNYSKYSNRYDYYDNFDIAILKLDTAFTLRRDEVSIIPLAPSNYNAKGNATISGWGRVDVFNLKTTNKLKYANVEILSETYCRSNPVDLIPGHMICAFKFSEGFCGGDSGGPLVQDIYNNGTKYVVGVVSYSLGHSNITHIRRDFCAVAPDYYVSVSKFNGFITQTMKNI